MSWYTQFRPRRVQELHLSSVRDQLLTYMKAGNFPQVFLFAGPKGTGKTSASRILGAMFNDPANAEVVEHNFFASAANQGRLSEKSSKEENSNLRYVEPDLDSSVNQLIFAGKSYVVHELDAASNRGIDDVRALKERVHMPPQDGKIAVYILDEAHMLTTEAFNALLKLLEEPPAHAVFILATTEHHKIPATVVSRTAEVQFRKATAEEIIQALTYVLDRVALTAADGVLEAIVDHANGSFRDAVKLLEKVATGVSKTKHAQISMEDVSLQLLGFVGDQAIIQLLHKVISKDSVAVSKQLAELRSQDVDPDSFYTRVLSLLHQSLLVSMGVREGEAPFTKQISLFLLDKLQRLSAQQEVIPLLQLEIQLLSIIERASSKKQTGGSSSSSGEKASANSASVSASKPGVTASTASTYTKVESNSVQEVLDTPDISDLGLTVGESEPKLHAPIISQTQPLKSDSLVIPDHVDSTELLREWSQFVDLVADRNKTIAALLRSAKPLVEKSNGIARVQVFYTFHRDQLMQPKFMQLLQDCAKDMTGQYHQFEFELGIQKDPMHDSDADEPVTTLVQELIM